MTNYPHHHPHDLMSETLLDQLVADAQNWRNLTQALNDRGFTDFGPTDIAAIVALYPNFRAMAHALPDDTDQKPRRPYKARQTRFLTPCGRCDRRCDRRP